MSDPPQFEWPTAYEHDAATAGEEAGGGSEGGRKRPCRRGLTVREVLETEPGLLETHRLSVHQWEKVTSHRSWHTSVLPLHKRRLVNLDGCARTLGALYRKGYLIQSEFVAYCHPDQHHADDDGEEGQAVASTAESEDGRRRGRRHQSSSGDDDEPGQNEEIHQRVAGGAEAHTGVGGAAAGALTTVLPERPRFFTPRECARLQGFPDTFLIDGLPNPNRWYHQCGNAVCPGVVAKIAQKVVAALQPPVRGRAPASDGT